MSPDEYEDNPELVSKTQRKKEMLALQELGETLTTLSPALLAKCNLSNELLHALAEYKRIPDKRGARKRQMQFLGRLKRDIDAEPIRRVLAEQGQQTELQKRRFHRLEIMRDRLIDGDQTALDELIAQYDMLDIQYVRQLLRNASQEASNNKPPAAARKLFVYLRELSSEE